MGKLKKRVKPCSRADDCCSYSPCQWPNPKKKAESEAKKVEKKEKHKKEKDKKKDEKKGKKGKKKD